MARSFNGTSDFINLGNSAALNPTGNFSVSSWIYPTNISPQSWVLARDDATLGRSFAFGMEGGGVISLQINGGASSLGGVTATANVWQQWGVAGSAGGTSWVGYKNGVAGTTAGTSAPASTTGNTTIGERTFSGFNGFWPGRIADVGFWNITLTAAEMVALAQGARPYTIRPASLLGYWPIYGLVSPEPDLSGNARNGTVTGTTFAFDPPIMMSTPRWPQLTISVTPTVFNLMPQACL
jgi:hypothetical protein